VREDEGLMRERRDDDRGIGTRFVHRPRGQGARRVRRAFVNRILTPRSACASTGRSEGEPPRQALRREGSLLQGDRHGIPAVHVAVDFVGAIPRASRWARRGDGRIPRAMASRTPRFAHRRRRRSRGFVVLEDKHEAGTVMVDVAGLELTTDDIERPAASAGGRRDPLRRAISRHPCS
jgi:hypothetical protein